MSKRIKVHTCLGRPVGRYLKNEQRKPNKGECALFGYVYGVTGGRLTLAVLSVRQHK